VSATSRRTDTDTDRHIRTMTLAAKIAKENLARQKKDDTRRELANEKAERLRVNEEARIKREAEEKFLRENEHLRKEIERKKWEAAELVRKTKTYYKFNLLNNEMESIALNPTYFGEHITDKKADSWVPHGPGQFLIGDEVVKEGVFHKGHLQSAGVQVFDDDSRWEGEFKMGLMCGVGRWFASKDAAPREALARDNKIVCYRDEITEGLQVEFEDATMQVVTNTRRPRASVMCHVKNWKYRVHFHDEIRPRERDVVFSTIAKFTLLHHLPRIYHTTRFEGAPHTDPPVRYDYYKDVYGKREEEIRLGITGGRRNINMKPHQATPLTPAQRFANSKTDYSENVMESAEVGIGAAKAIAEKARLAELKKQQFAALIETRRKEEEAKRKAMIEEEQKKIMEEDLAKQKETFQKKKQEKERLDRADVEAMQSAMAAATEAEDVKDVAAAALRAEREANAP